jgi:hypothetical protein
VRKTLPTAFALLLTTAALLLARLWLQRLSLPYNEEGRYFDAAHGVVYDEGAIAVYGVLTVLFALLAVATRYGRGGLGGGENLMDISWR